MAESQAAAVDEMGGYDLEDDEFETPPDSPDDVKITLTAELEQEIADTLLAEEHIRKNQESIAKSLESVRELQTTMAKLINQAESRTSELRNRTCSLKAMKHEIDEISMEAIAQEEEELKKLIKTEAAHISEETEQKNQLEKLHSKISPHTEKYSFTTTVDGDCLSCEFTSVDPDSPDAVYTIKLTLKNGLYHCTKCEPELEQENLIAQLNDNHDFEKFFALLRQNWAPSATEN